MEHKQKFLRPIKSKSVVQTVIDRITLAIINKELRPGDKIPTEQELSESFGASRNSVREAVKVLVSFGVLEIRRPEGTFVSNGFSDMMIDPLLYGIILDDTESMNSLKELREWIDIGIIRLAIDKATEEDIELLEECVSKMRTDMASGDFTKVYEADNHFHDILARITHNSLFGKIAHLTRLLTTDIRYKTIHHMQNHDQSEQLLTVHVDMLEAIKSRNPEGVEAIIKRSYFYDEGALEG